MQTSYSLDPALGREGQLADSRILSHVIGRLANGFVRAGKAVFRTTGFGQPGSNNRDPGSVYQNPTPGAAASATSLLASGGQSSTSIQTINGTAFNGAGPGTPSLGTDMAPARRIALVLSNSANWLATNATLTGVNHLGQTVSETLAIPANGNATVLSVGYFKRIVSLTLPVQGGTGGTFTVGVAILDATVDAVDLVGFAVYDAAQYTPVTPNQNGTAEYRDSDTVPIMVKGCMWVVTEDACAAGQPAFVRIAASGGNTQLGAVRSDVDTAAAVAIPNGRFVRDSLAGGLNQLEIF